MGGWRHSGQARHSAVLPSRANSSDISGSHQLQKFQPGPLPGKPMAMPGPPPSRPVSKKVLPASSMCWPSTASIQPASQLSAFSSRFQGRDRPWRCSHQMPAGNTSATSGFSQASAQAGASWPINRKLSVPVSWTISQGSVTHRPAPISKTSQVCRSSQVLSSISNVSTDRPATNSRVSKPTRSRDSAVKTLAASMPVSRKA